MSDKMRWGILGTANVAKQAFAPVVIGSEKSVLTAIGSRSLESAEEFAREFGIPHVYGSYNPKTCKVLLSGEGEIIVPAGSGALCVRAVDGYLVQDCAEVRH